MLNPTIWTNMVRTMLESAEMREHVFLGTTLFGDYPFLLSKKRPNRHLWITGGSASGKTARLLATYTTQRLLARDTSVVIIDPKPDKALFENARLLCDPRLDTSSGIALPFRYVSQTPGRQSYAY